MDDVDCLTCGACCFQRPGTILVTVNDIVRFRRAERTDLIAQLDAGDFSQMAFKMNEQGSCVRYGSKSSPLPAKSTTYAAIPAAILSVEACSVLSFGAIKGLI